MRGHEEELSALRDQLRQSTTQCERLRAALIQKESELQRLARRTRLAPAPPTEPPTEELESPEAAAEAFALEESPLHERRDLSNTEDHLTTISDPDLDEEEEEEEEDGYQAYDEEADFLGPDRAILERRRQLDRERNEREIELGEESFWMICPRCGEHLTEHEFDSIKVERCEACGALCIDRGESDLLMLMSADDRSLAYRTRGLLQ
ncbi:MAG: hypothetical protein GF330_02730 [Candidatus Eisenbacteria bacterium]|nr:hypothetical protein [Candidatus Eisenbacteria bacterium]